MDLAAYAERSRTGPCFVCEFLAGNPDFDHHTIHEDEACVIFFEQIPNAVGLYNYLTQSPCRRLAFELSEAQYLDLQIKVHRIARVLKKEFDAERIYVLSLGSQEGNSHLHWHLVPLPRGVPYSQQQYHALMAEHGIIAMTPEEMARMAKRIGDRYRTALAAAS